MSLLRAAIAAGTGQFAARQAADTAPAYSQRLRRKYTSMPIPIAAIAPSTSG